MLTYDVTFTRSAMQAMASMVQKISEVHVNIAQALEQNGDRVVLTVNTQTGEELYDVLRSYLRDTPDTESGRTLDLKLRNWMSRLERCRVWAHEDAYATKYNV